MITFFLRTLENICSVHDAQTVCGEKGSHPHHSSSASWEGPCKTMQQLPPAKRQKAQVTPRQCHQQRQWHIQ